MELIYFQIYARGYALGMRMKLERTRTAFLKILQEIPSVKEEGVKRQQH